MRDRVARRVVDTACIEGGTDNDERKRSLMADTGTGRCGTPSAPLGALTSRRTHPAAPPPTVTQPRERAPAAPTAPARPAPTKAAPAGKEEEITVYIEKAGVDKKGKDPRYWVKADTGAYYSTFEVPVGEALIAAKETQTTIRYVTNDKGFHNVTAVGETAQAMPEDANIDQGKDGPSDDLPF